MYEKIKEVLKANNITFNDVAWIDEFQKIQLNNKEDFNEYVIDSIDGGISFYREDNTGWIYYKVMQGANLGFTNVFILEKENNE